MVFIGILAIALLITAIYFVVKYTNTKSTYVHLAHKFRI